MVLMPFLSWLSNISRHGWLTHGELRNVCSSFGALNDIFSRMSASCADNKDRRLIIIIIIIIILVYYKHRILDSGIRNFVAAIAGLQSRENSDETTR